MVEVTNRKYKTGRKIDVSLILSRPIQTFVAGFGFPVFEIELVPENAIMLEDDKINTTANIRKKRQDVGSFPPCNGNALSERKYGYTKTAECDYLTFCEPEGCGPQHVRDRIYYTCLCCPEHNRVSECYFCSEL